MNSAKYYLIHLLVICLLQVLILDNIDLGSYVYLNIYVLGIYLLPYRIKGVSLLLIGFLLGLLMDLADHTYGIHAAATTFACYIRPRLLQLTSNREELDTKYGSWRREDFGWFLKYTALSTLLFNGVLVMLEAFTFTNLQLSLIRILLSTTVSLGVMLIYYYVGVRTNKLSE